MMEIFGSKRHDLLAIYVGRLRQAASKIIFDLPVVSFFVFFCSHIMQVNPYPLQDHVVFGFCLA